MPGTSTPAPTPAAAALTVDALVDATPDTRDRVVDLLRAVSIAVVVLWHWTFSLTHWRGGALRMPNPMADVPGPEGVERSVPLTRQAATGSRTRP